MIKKSLRPRPGHVRSGSQNAPSGRTFSQETVPFHWRSLARWNPAGLVVVTIGCVVGLSGCGGSGPAEPTVVPPPAPSVVAQPKTAGEAPGGLEMPTGEIPPSATVGEEKKNGGIEMPKDATVPVDSGVQSQPTSDQPAVLYGSWDEIEATAKASGQVTVVDLWSLACEPCLKEFPGLVELHKSLGAKVHCVAVDIDFDGRKSRPPEHYEQPVREFLSSVDAEGFPVYICQTPSDDVYEATGLVSIPAVMIFDQEGKIVKVFVDAGETAGFTYEKDVLPLVNQLVAG